VVGDQSFVVALGDSIIGVNAQSDIVRRIAVPLMAGRDGLARDVGDRLGAWQVVAGTLLAVPAVAWYVWREPVRCGCGQLAVLVGSCAWAWYVRRRLGGTTGDCVGFACYLGQLLFLLVVVRYPQ
jgi:adenosylcobinamide-GDP ribazoletransferase